MSYQNVTCWGQVVGSVHKLLATNNEHRNLIIIMSNLYKCAGINGEALQLCAVYVIDTACLGFMVNNNLSSRVDPEDKGGYCKL